MRREELIVEERRKNKVVSSTFIKDFTKHIKNWVQNRL